MSIKSPVLWIETGNSRRVVQTTINKPIVLKVYRIFTELREAEIEHWKIWNDKEHTVLAYIYWSTYNYTLFAQLRLQYFYI